MSWESEYVTIVPDVTREEIWTAWADVDSWNRWDLDLEFTTLEGAFAKGTWFVLRPKGGPKVRIQLTEVVPLEGYTDLTRFPGARMWGIHTMRDTDRGLALRTCIRVEGPLGFIWRKIVAEGVANGMAKQTNALVNYVQAQRIRETSHA
ncbi:hypothetical protein BH09GEM1_BH09GEM1_32810 [soil metagenome]